MVGATITCPLEVVKTVLQSKENSHSLSKVVGGIFKHEGVAGFWKGLGPMVLGVVPARATYFATYDGTKVLHSPLHHPRVGSSSKHTHFSLAPGADPRVPCGPIWAERSGYIASA